MKGVLVGDLYVVGVWEFSFEDWVGVRGIVWG